MPGIGTAVAVLIFAASAAGCGSLGQPQPSGGSLTVVTSTTVFADMVQNVGGSLVSVTSLVPRNGDVHTYDPRPADIRAVASARLLVMNGLGLDDWLEKAITNAAVIGTPLVKLAVDLPGVPLLPGEDPGTQNPHLWMDVRYAELYVDRIEAGLAAVDPQDASIFARNAATYKTQLAQLDTSIRTQIATIPVANRKLVSFHDAFPYFAREYGITIVGVAVQAPGQDPSAGDTAQLITAIKAAGVKAIFSESQFPTKLVDQLAQETGARVVANLYDDALGDPPVTSYVALMQWDVDQVVTALR